MSIFVLVIWNGEQWDDSKDDVHGAFVNAHDAYTTGKAQSTCGSFTLEEWCGAKHIKDHEYSVNMSGEWNVCYIQEFPE